jgi:hypothetical protein
VGPADRWVPEYVRLELDAFCTPIRPAVRVTALFERRHVWERLIQMDGVTRAIVQGKLCYPLVCWSITPSYLPNHKSCQWEEADEGGHQDGRLLYPGCA